MPDSGPTPFADAVDAFLRASPTPFSTPGHKRVPGLIDGDPLLAVDVPHHGGADDLRGSLGILGAAESLAARAWGADFTRFAVHGSTHPNQALCLTAAGPGERVIVARTSHRSVFAGLVLSGAEPVWVTPDVDAVSGLALAVPAARVADAFERAPDARAVLLVEPSWLGLLSDLEAIAGLCAARGAALICDQAWGAHFGFHPELPRTALARGADGIAISIHKTLTAFTQGAMLHAVDRGRLDLERLATSFDTLYTTSPSGTILASLDRSRALLERDGERLLGRALPLAAAARQRIAAIPGVTVTDERLLAEPSVAGWDPLKLVIDVSASGADGIDVDRDLRAAGILLEGAGRTTLVPLLTLADSEESIDRLCRELERAVERRRGTAGDPPRASTAWRVRPEQVLTPREAFFARSERVPAARAAGRVSAELAAPYPPGVPALAPGELIGADLLAELRDEARGGTRIAGVSDPTLATVLVVAS